MLAEEYLHGTTNEKEFLEMSDLVPFSDALKACKIAYNEALEDVKNNSNAYISYSKGFPDAVLNVQSIDKLKK